MRERLHRLPLRRLYLLPLACALAAAILAASEFMTMFEFPVNGTVVETVSAGSRHSYALLVVSIFAIVALAVTLLTGQRPAAVAVAAAGAVALLIFLVVDLPDVNQVGALDKPRFVDSRAEPAAGFWFALAGSILLALTGAALATLKPEQLEEMAFGTESEPSPTESVREEPQAVAGRGRSGPLRRASGER